MTNPHSPRPAGTLFLYTGKSAMDCSRQDGLEWRKELRLREGHSRNVTCFQAAGLGHPMQRHCYSFTPGQEQAEAVLAHYLPEGAEAGMGGRSSARGTAYEIDTSDSETTPSACKARAQQGQTRTPHHAGAACAQKQRKVLPVKGKSRFRGVSWRNYSKTWKVVVCHAKKQRIIGEYDDEEEAARAYDREALRIK
jgi:hypothetical protein